ncbi:urease accessory protein UreF [Roseinatronobacter alkalisoli]|uniref:Urease accessory protein UreF n=1 Tax=Roseinatronobacter alkalisoli TaxID=3028235 RepID=A0ABT5T411_9RHOB|nr:urease accessory UreF family protein [Roseinatronobacter sp. HJB301]MDD7969862.1 urease accessory UreF family protein [Roseinatronobacter sp. HJB301]
MSPAALTLVQWLSPAFPTGAFAYSHGLEQVIADGCVHDAASLHDWLADVVQFGTGWQDAVLMTHALKDGADPDALDALCVALQPCAERLQEAREQGAAFARTLGTMTGQHIPARTLPLTVACAARPLDLPAKDVIALYLQAFVSNLVTMGVKHIPLGQSAGQKVLADLLPLIVTIATNAETAEIDAFANSCLAADLAAMHHEIKETRLYRT